MLLISQETNTVEQLLQDGRTLCHHMMNSTCSHWN